MMAVGISLPKDFFPQGIVLKKYGVTTVVKLFPKETK
jgi:hypothetical protein